METHFKVDAASSCDDIFYAMIKKQKFLEMEVSLFLSVFKWNKKLIFLNVHINIVFFKL